MRYSNFGLFCPLDLIYQINQMVAAVHITASVVKLATFALVLGLQWICKKQGLVTSGILLLFWALSAILGSATFRFGSIFPGNLEKKKTICIKIMLKLCL